jgi:hypothetical protein
LRSKKSSECGNESDQKFSFENLPEEIRAIVFRQYIRDFELYLDCIYIHPREQAIFQNTIFYLNKRLRIEALRVFLVDRPFFTYSQGYEKRMNWFRRWVAAGNTPKSMVSVETHLQSLKISVIGSFKIQLPQIYESLGTYSNLRELTFSGIPELQTTKQLIRTYNLDDLRVVFLGLPLLRQVGFYTGPFTGGKAPAFKLMKLKKWVLSKQGDEVSIDEL